MEWTHLHVSSMAKMLLNFGYSHRLIVGPRTSLNSFIQQEFCLRKEVLWLHFTLDNLCSFVHLNAQKTNCSWGSPKLTGAYLLSKIPFDSFFPLHTRKVAPKPGIWSRGEKWFSHVAAKVQSSHLSLDAKTSICAGRWFGYSRGNVGAVWTDNAEGIQNVDCI